MRVYTVSQNSEYGALTVSAIGNGFFQMNVSNMMLIIIGSYDRYTSITLVMRGK